MTHPAPTPSGRGHDRARGANGERGAVTVLALVLLLGVLALVALVVEAGSALAAHRKLLDTADAAARAGATALDLEVYRASGGQTAQLDPAQAEQVARRHLRANRYSGAASVTATTTSVTVQLTRDHPPLVFSFVPPIQLTAQATAEPQTGILEPSS